MAALVAGPRQLGRRQTLRVLLYHRISEASARESALSPFLITARPTVFERQLRHLTQAYHPVGVDEVLAAIAGRHVLPPRAVLVTFDDAYRDFGEVGWPLLRSHGVPAVLFVPTDFATDSSRVFWWDAIWQMLARTRRTDLAVAGLGEFRLETDDQRRFALGILDTWMKTLRPARRAAVLEQMQCELDVRVEPTHAVLSWDELRRLHKDGVVVAPHSRTHELLDQVDPGTLDAEVTGSREDLLQQMGSCAPLFAYPNGNVDRQVEEKVRRAGFQMAFTTAPGLNRLSELDPFLVRRDHAGRSVFRFAIKLIGPVGHTRARQHPLLSAR